MELSAEAKTLIHLLRQKPEWYEILDAIKPKPLPRYKTSKTLDRPVETQINDWVKSSGEHEYYERLCKLLGESK